MGIGIQVWNADGTLQFDSSNRLFRTLTIVSTGTDGGFVDVPTDQGTISPVFVDESNSGPQPEVIVSGGRVTWGWGDIPLADRKSVKLNVEVF